jgi:UDP-galactopyranose mutase
MTGDSLLQTADLVIVGAGLFGLTIAHRAAKSLGLKVVVIERRPHIGGNAMSAVDPDTGIEVHSYGSHLFHCNSEDVWSFVNQFSAFSDYRHHVFTTYRGKVYPMPINLGTICTFFERAMSPSEARALLTAQAQERGLASEPETFEDKAISLIGRPLYEAFIRGYTAKQWQTDPRQLPADIISRLPVRFTFNSRYFNDRFEGLPLNGYAQLFTRMLDVPNMRVMLNADYFELREQIKPEALVVYTGPIDRYFDFCFGALSWRTLDFEREVVEESDFQGTSVMNYADEDIPFTRIHEFRHLHPERSYSCERTVIFREYSRFAGQSDEPYYPINTRDDRKVYQAYRKLAENEPRTIFGGRLGTYRYLDMHQAIGSALKAFDNVIVPHFRQGKPITGEASKAAELAA